MNLTDLFIIMPDWLYFWLVRKLKLEAGLAWIFEEIEEGLHELAGVS